MNELNEIDKALMEAIKAKTEHLAGLSGTADLSQKDFDFLQYYIQEKTGEALSLTTLKRIWRKEYQRLPHLSTLNMLSQIAYNVDWHTAKSNGLRNRQQTISYCARRTKKSKNIQHLAVENARERSCCCRADDVLPSNQYSLGYC